MVEIWSYKEKKEKRFARICWALVNALIFPLLTKEWRKRILRCFGARLGIHLRVYRSVKIYAPWNLVLEGTGGPVCIGPRVEIYNKAPIKIGSNVVISQDAYLCTASHDIASPSMRLVTKPIVIGEQAWIGARATIMPGVEIKEGCVIGACAVVTKSTEPWTVVGGNPAKKLKERIIRVENKDE